MRQIGAEREYHVEIEELCQRRKEKRSEKIRVESDKISADQSGASYVVQNDVEKGEYPIQEGRQTTAAKYTGIWKIMKCEPQQRRRRTTMEAWCRCRIIGMVEKVSGEDSGRRSQWRRCGTAGMYTAA